MVKVTMCRFKPFEISSVYNQPKRRGHCKKQTPMSTMGLTKENHKKKIREKTRLCQARYRANNKENILEKQRLYNEKCKEKWRESNKRNYEKNK